MSDLKVFICIEVKKVSFVIVNDDGKKGVNIIVIIVICVNVKLDNRY